FAWSYQIVGTDGLLHKGEKGETAEIIVDVKNVGTGTAFDAYAALRNLSEDRINVKKGRTKLGPLKPGETKSATFVLEVKKPLEDTVPVRLEVGDKELYEAQRDKLLLPAAPPIPLGQRQRRERDARAADLHPARERLPEGVLPHRAQAGTAGHGSARAARLPDGAAAEAGEQHGGDHRARGRRSAGAADPGGAPQAAGGGAEADRGCAHAEIAGPPAVDHSSSMSENRSLRGSSGFFCCTAGCCCEGTAG